MSFCFNRPCDPTVGLGSQKRGSLKYFEICGIQEKELLVNQSTNINPIGMVICPKKQQSNYRTLSDRVSKASTPSVSYVVQSGDSSMGLIGACVKENICLVQVSVHYEPYQSETTNNYQCSIEVLSKMIPVKSQVKHIRNIISFRIHYFGLKRTPITFIQGA
jgi:hypothetical protein